MLEAEARLGRDLVEYLTEARYQRFLTNQQIADEIDSPGMVSASITEGTVGYWFTVLRIRHKDMHARAQEDREAS